VSGYNFYRGSKSGGPYTKLNSSLTSGTSYIDGSVAASTTYYYVTTAVNSSGQESSYSNQVQVAIP
jgi:fibronectin type 3 domain-containing protein